jgi:uncharacterized membrane protein YjdF
MFLMTSLVVAIWSLWKFYGIGGGVPEYDKLLHFLGGFTCGIFGAFIAVYGPFDPLRPLASHNRLVLGLALASAFVIGGAWEVAEYTIDAMRDYLPWDAWDTFFDLCFDLVGAATAAWVYQLEDHNKH